MRFAFTEEQLAFRTAVRGLLARSCPATAVRAAWDGSTNGRDPARWKALAEAGALGLLIDEARGGLGGSAIDLVLPIEEAGRAALPEPLVETALVAAPLLAGTASPLADEWLPRVASGEAVITTLLDGDPFVADAHFADRVIVQRGDSLLLVDPRRARLVPQPTVDGARRLFRIDLDPADVTVLASGEAALGTAAFAFDRGALGLAAMQLGLAARMIELTVAHVTVREQFGRPIGSFQAVKHHLADALLALEFARPLVHRAALSVSRGAPHASLHASMARVRADDAARLVSKKALQCHGAIGYSFEYDLHLYMKRSWALACSFGTTAFHRHRVGAALLDADTPPPDMFGEP
ncbi:MAG: acyl-CoA dehydrogenase [Thermoleophilia bacterium]|nr:acyl-CoA dehydrogenase [Thermoleophilia bacterium]